MMLLNQGICDFTMKEYPHCLYHSIVSVVGTRKFVTLCVPIMKFCVKKSSPVTYFCEIRLTLKRPLSC